MSPAIVLCDRCYSMTCHLCGHQVSAAGPRGASLAVDPVHGMLVPPLVLNRLETYYSDHQRAVHDQQEGPPRL